MLPLGVLSLVLTWPSGKGIIVFLLRNMFRKGCCIERASQISQDGTWHLSSGSKGAVLEYPKVNNTRPSWKAGGFVSFGLSDPLKINCNQLFFSEVLHNVESTLAPLGSQYGRPSGSFKGYSN